MNRRLVIILASSTLLASGCAPRQSKNTNLFDQSAEAVWASDDVVTVRRKVRLSDLMKKGSTTLDFGSCPPGSHLHVLVALHNDTAERSLRPLAEPGTLEPDETVLYQFLLPQRSRLPTASEDSRPSSVAVQGMTVSTEVLEWSLWVQATFAAPTGN